MSNPPLTRDQAIALEPRLRAILAALYAIQSAWRDSHGVPLWLPPPTAPQVAAELRDLAALLDPPRPPGRITWRQDAPEAAP